MVSLRYTAIAILVVILMAGNICTAGAAPYQPDVPPTLESLSGITGNNYWTSRGPQRNTSASPAEAPQVMQIVYDKTNPNIVYAGTNQGVYRSSDGGSTWEPRSKGLMGYGALVISGLAIDSADPQKLVIGTWGYGLFASSDGGANWTRLTDPLATPTNSLVQLADPSFPSAPPEVRIGDFGYNYGIHYDIPPANDKAHIVEALPENRFLLSSDKLMSPQGVPSGISWTPVRRIAINPNNGNEIIACISGYGVYRSIDRGIHWSKLEVGSGSGWAYAFASSNTQIRYVSTSGGLFRSTNGGTTWVQVGSTTIAATVFSIAVHPTNPSIIVVGTLGDGLYRSTNGGDSWTKVSTELDDSSYYSVAFSSSNPNIVYAGGYVWVYRSADSGATWSNADSSIYSWYFEGLAIHPTQPATVLVGANNFPYGGVFKRTQDTASFQVCPYGMEDTYVLDIEQDPLNPSVLYVATWGAGVFRSDDAGITWGARYGYPYVYSLEATQSPTTTILYAGTFYVDVGILKSYTRGDIWEEVSNDYPSSISFGLRSIYDDAERLVAGTINGIQYSYDGGENWYTASGLNDSTGVVLKLCEFPGTGRMLAATYGGGVFYSWGGNSWYEANVGITGMYGGYVYDVACSPDTPGLAYAVGAGVYRTLDYGEHWHSFAVGLPSDYYRSVDIVPTTGDVFVGSQSHGNYFSSYGKSIWLAINNGLGEFTSLPMLAVESISNTPVRVFVGTNGRGTWDYTVTARPTIHSVYLPLTLRSYYRFSSTTDPYESNNYSAQAYLLAGPGNYDAYIWTTSDDDWYRLNVSTLGPITIDLKSIPSGTDYDVELYTATGLRVGGSWMGGNADERIVFQPMQTGQYYVVIYSYSGSSQVQAYRLSLVYNGVRGSGRIYGTVTENGYTQKDIPIVLYYYNGYRTTRVSTLTDSSGAYNFWGMATLPVGHTYGISYPNYEGNTQRLGYWSCWSFTGYQVGQTKNTCSFDVKGIPLTYPYGGDTRTLPLTFQWGTRGIAGDNYQFYLYRNSPTYAYYYAPYTTGGTYTLNSLPSGFTYGPTNYWYIDLQNDFGYGYSYYTRSIIFSSSLNTTQSTGDEQIPTCDFAAKEDFSGIAPLFQCGRPGDKE